MNLLSVQADAKTKKGTKDGFLTGIMYLIPDDKICPMAKAAGCREACLVSAGRGRMTPVKAGRQRKTDWFYNDRETFMRQLIKDIKALTRKANRENMTPAVRLNGTSDINWFKIKVDGMTIFDHFPTVQFYDYTKSPAIIRDAAKVENWHITASYSEAGNKYAKIIAKAAKQYGANLAAVFPKDRIPATFLGRKVIDGDKTDLRFLDEDDSIVALKAKGDAKHDTSGFVVRLDDIAAY
jgi:hypothetical protein